MNAVFCEFGGFTLLAKPGWSIVHLINLSIIFDVINFS